MTFQARPSGPQYRAFQSRLLSIDDSARTIEFAASTETADRYGDVIRVAGWKLDNFQKNPVFLWAHRSEDPPIGRIIGAKKELGTAPALVETVQFASADTYPFADTIFKLYKDGFLNAVSVGFMPLEYQPRMEDDDDGISHQEGWDFTSVEQLELSAVPIPANPEALGRVLKSATRRNGQFDMQKLGHAMLLEAKSMGLISGQEVERAEKWFSFGETNPPWSYSIPGVTIPANQNSARSGKQVSEHRAASQRDAGDEMVDSLKRRVKELEDCVKELQANHKSLKKNVDEMSDDFDGLSDSVKGWGNELDGIRRANKSLNDDVDSLRAKHKDLDGDVDSLKVKHRELDDDVDALAAKHKDLDSECKDMDSDVEGLKKSHVEMKGAHSFLSNDHDSTKKRVKDLEDDVEGLKEKVKDDGDDDTETAGAPNSERRNTINSLDEMFRALVKP